MINEQKNEQSTLIKIKNNYLVSEKINLFSLYSFFLNYLYNQKLVLVFIVIVIPIGILCQSIFINHHGKEILAVSIGIAFISSGTSVTMYMMMGFLIDLKMSTVYKRIGLLGIKPFGFIVIIYAYCFTLVLVSDLLILISSFIITAILKKNFANVYNFVVFMFFFTSIFIIAFLINLIIIVIILVNSRIIQSIVTGIFSILFVGGPFIIPLIFSSLFVNNYKQVLLSFVGFSINLGIILGLIILTGFLT